MRRHPAGELECAAGGVPAVQPRARHEEAVGHIWRRGRHESARGRGQRPMSEGGVFERVTGLLRGRQLDAGGHHHHREQTITSIIKLRLHFTIIEDHRKGCRPYACRCKLAEGRGLLVHAGLSRLFSAFPEHVELFPIERRRVAPQSRLGQSRQ